MNEKKRESRNALKAIPSDFALSSEVKSTRIKKEHKTRATKKQKADVLIPSVDDNVCCFESIFSVISFVDCCFIITGHKEI